MGAYFPTHRRHAEFNVWHRARLDARRPSLGIVLAYLWYWSRARARTASPSATRLARAGYTVLENKYYLDHLYTDIIVGGVKGPIARAAYWFNQNVIDGVVNGVGTASPVEAGGASTTTSTRASSTASSTARAPAPRAAARSSARSRPARSSSTAPLFLGAAVLAGIFVLSSAEELREITVKDLLDDWGLSARRVPAAGGRGGDDGHPQGRGGAPQGGRPGHQPGRRSPSASLLAGQLRLRPDAASCSSSSNKQWIDAHQQPLHRRPRRHLAAAARCSRCFIVPLVIIYSWNHFPEPHNPKAFLILILILETGMVGTFVAAGPHPLLRVLRGRPAADVLHDRRVGRRAAPVRRRSSSSSTRCSARR